MKIAALALGVVIISSSSAVFAQTCANPLPIKSNDMLVGDTCTGSNASFPQFPGGIASPQNDVVYSFVAQGANATITVDSNGSALVPGIVVMNPCDSNAGNITQAAGNNNGQAVVMVNGLTDGVTYYVVVTTDPGAGAPANNCGAYNITVNGILPVDLQKFSVE